MKLRAKTSILIALVVVALIIIVAGASLRYQERALRDNILAGVGAVAATASLNIEAFVRDGRHSAALIAGAVPRQPLVDGRDLARVGRMLEQSVALAPRFRNGLFILDADGRFLVDYPAHPDLHGESFAFRDYYQRAIAERGPVISQPYISKRTGKPVITFATPITAADGKILAILGCSVDLLAEDALGPVLKQRIGKTGYIYAMDHTRQMILHPDVSRVLKRDVPPGTNRMLDAAIDGFQGVGETVNSRGVAMLIAVRQIPGTSWFVAAQVPRDEALQPVEEVRWAVVRIAALSLLLALIVGMWAANRITRPLGTLHRAAAAINRELGADRVDLSPARPAVDMLRTIHGSDEMSDLARMVETLMDRLDHTLHSLKLAAAEWERTFHAVADPIFRLDEDWRIAQLNSAAADWLRETPAALIGKRVDEVLFGASLPDDWPRRDTLQGADAQREFRWQASIDREGRQTWEFSAIAMYDGEGRRAGAILVARDISARLVEEEKIRALAFRDTLTGLPNRLLLADRLQQALAGASRDGPGVAVIFLDLDRFKEVNDTHGHQAGDAVLTALALRMQECLRGSDTLARLGGDEFVIVLPNLGSAQDAVVVAEKILDVVSRPIDLPGAALQVSVSIGIAFYPACGEAPEELMRAADAAMYRAKQQGPNTYRLSERTREPIAL
jgi:diguanylate cyclase (GGDEF)-like protein/PAS domain S-box-containing protein